jgi:hypothetical protein
MFKTNPCIHCLSHGGKREQLFYQKTLREENRLSVFENRVLREIFGPKKDEVTGGGTKQENEKLKS